MMIDHIYGDVSSGSLPQARWCLPQFAGDSVGDEEDSIIAAGVVGEANEEIVMEIFDFLLGLGA